MPCVYSIVQFSYNAVDVLVIIKEMRHIEMPIAAPKKSIRHFQNLEMILKWNKQNTVRLPQKYQFLLIKH